MQIDVFDLENKKVGDIELDDSIFGADVREHLFWEVVNWQRAKRRAGTHKIKSRAEVRGGGRKPFRQKGTGRARQGTTRAPHWVGGGIVFGPLPRDYSYAMPKKKRRAALRSALSMKARDGKLRIVESLVLPEAKTKRAVALMGAFEATGGLFVDVAPRDAGSNEVKHNNELRLSVRNLKNAKYLATDGLNVEDVLRYDFLFLSRNAAAQVLEVLK